MDTANGEPSLGYLRHIHIFTSKDKQVFAMNVDGTAHDGCHDIQIDEGLIEFLKTKVFQFLLITSSRLFRLDITCLSE
jgi:hypothetical protein